MKGNGVTPQNRRGTGVSRLRGGHPASIGKATQFKPGQSGNPGGRPRVKMLSEAYKAVLEHDCRTPFKPITHAEAIAEKLVKEAEKGKVTAAAEIADRVEGKPRQAFDVKLSIMDELAERIEKGRKRLKSLGPGGHGK
jgi:Family of unknown function (DUF5681)